MRTLSKIFNDSNAPASLFGKGAATTGWLCWVSRPYDPKESTPNRQTPLDTWPSSSSDRDSPNWVIGTGPRDWGVCTSAGIFWIYDEDFKIKVFSDDGAALQELNVRDAGSVEMLVKSDGGVELRAAS